MRITEIPQNCENPTAWKLTVRGTNVAEKLEMMTPNTQTLCVNSSQL